MKQKHQEIYDFTVGYITSHGYPPSIREICTGTGIRSTSSVHVYIRQMVKAGILETDAGLDRCRAIRVPGYRFVKADYK